MFRLKIDGIWFSSQVYILNGKVMAMHCESWQWLPSKMANDMVAHERWPPKFTSIWTGIFSFFQMFSVEGLLFIHHNTTLTITLEIPLGILFSSLLTCRIKVIHQSGYWVWLNTPVSVYLNSINQNLPSIVNIGDESSTGGQKLILATCTFSMSKYQLKHYSLKGQSPKLISTTHVHS